MYLPDDDLDLEPEDYGYDNVYADMRTYQREMERGRRESEKRGRELGREFERAAEERRRAAEERHRELERARREREKVGSFGLSFVFRMLTVLPYRQAHAQMQSAMLHVSDQMRSKSRSRSRSASRNRQDNTVDITVNLDDADSHGYTTQLVDLLTNHVNPVAASGANVNIHINSVANSGSRRKTPEPPAQSDYSSFFGIPNPGFEAPGRAGGRSPSPNPSLVPNPKSNSGNRRPSPSPARAAATAPAFASSSAPAHMPAPAAAKHSRAPSPNPTPKSSKRPQTVETTAVVSADVKKSYAMLDEVKAQFERQRTEFVFPSVIDFQNSEGVVRVNVRRSVADIVASSVAQDKLMDLDVDLAEEAADEEISMPKLAYTPTNSVMLSYVDVLEKLIIRLDGVSSHRDEGLRSSRRRLVKEVGREVERVERFWTGVWKEEAERKEKVTEEEEMIQETVPEMMQDGRASPEPTLTVEPPVEEELDAIQVDDVDEDPPVHVERPDSATVISDEKVDHKDHATEPDDWVDVAPSASAHADKAAEAGVPSIDAGPSIDIDAVVDLDDVPPSYEQSMSLTFSDGLPDQDQVGVQAAGEEEENLETSTSTLSSISEKDNKERKVRRPRVPQLHVVNGDGEQDAEWVPVSAKGL